MKSLILGLVLVASSVAFEYSIPRMPVVRAPCSDLNYHYATPGDCFVVETAITAAVQGDNTESSISCSPGNVLTSCECVIVNPDTTTGGAYCDGVLIQNSGHTCTVRAAKDGGTVEARATCGRVSGTVSVTSFPSGETFAASNPTVTCGLGSVLIGCYVYTDFGDLYAAEAVPVVDGNTCKTFGGCASCRVQAVCIVPQQGFPAEYCPCSTVVVGSTVYNDGDVSLVTCPAGETITHCECEKNSADARCDGVTLLSNGNTCRAHSGSTNAPPVGIKARACCGKLGGNVLVVGNPEWDDHAQNPEVECPSDYLAISCYAHTYGTQSYPDDSHLETTTVGDDMCLVPNCDLSGGGCHVEAVCYQSTPCSVDGDWTTWAVTSTCSATCGGGSEVQQRECTNPSPEWEGEQCLKEDQVTRALSEVKQVVCNEAPCPINGDWNTWSEWITCDASCGGGSWSRTRECTRPSPQFNGLDCQLQGANAGLGTTETETENCNEQPCPIDGGWNEWFIVGQGCPVNCLDDNILTEGRDCSAPEPQHGGTCTKMDGTGALSETRTAHCSFFCEVNGGWSNWQDVSTCSASCGGGTLTQTRNCNNPYPAYGGAECDKLDGTSGLCDEQTVDCNTQNCPMHGTVQFSDSTFELLENVGTAQLVLLRTGGSDGSVTVSYTINEISASEGVDYVGDSGVLTFSGGQTSLTLNIPIIDDTEDEQDESFEVELSNPQGGVQIGTPDTIVVTIIDDDVDGGWTTWADTTACDVSCGGGFKTQTRHCTNPSPEGGGSDCQLTNLSYGTTEVDTEVSCNPEPCPIDGDWETWGAFSPCTEPCGTGTQSRSRDCNAPEPEFGGDWCTRDSDGQLALVETETQNCNTDPCPVNGGWGDWSTWTACPGTCGGGTQTSERLCNNPTPAYSGQLCLRDDQVTYAMDETRTLTCNQEVCPDTTVSDVCNGLHGVGTTTGYAKTINVGSCHSKCAEFGLTCENSIKTYPNPNTPPHVYSGCGTSYSNGCCCHTL